MIFVVFYFLWILFFITIVVMGWKKIDGSIRIYGLITLSGLHLLGVFIVYGLFNRIPLW
jgi:hypothetical protein